jgi:hypothetical protein
MRTGETILSVAKRRTSIAKSKLERMLNAERMV